MEGRAADRLRHPSSRLRAGGCSPAGCGQATSTVLTVLSRWRDRLERGVRAPRRAVHSTGPASRHHRDEPGAQRVGRVWRCAATGGSLAFCLTTRCCADMPPADTDGAESSAPRIGYGCSTRRTEPPIGGRGNACSPQALHRRGPSYEQLNLPDPVEGMPVSAWDRTEWFAVSLAPLYPPPYQVHVDIEASAGCRQSRSANREVGAREAQPIPAQPEATTWSRRLGALVRQARPAPARCRTNDNGGEGWRPHPLLHLRRREL